MKTLRRFFFNLPAMLALLSCSGNHDYIGLTLVPPGRVTDKVDLDIRAGVVNNGDADKTYSIYMYLGDEADENILLQESVSLKPGESYAGKYILDTDGMSGENEISLKIESASGQKHLVTRPFEVVKSEIRSTRQIDGAWAGLYHWSEEEGRHWNKDIKELTADQWRELVKSMHSVGMDVVVIQEVFRNNDYVGQHSTTVENYQGRAFYPSKLYPGRMPIASEDPVEAILSEADELGMSVFVGVGMFAWFDFTAESLNWHKRVASELWERYGHHSSFYGFYISEECAGNLYSNV